MPEYEDMDAPLGGTPAVETPAPSTPPEPETPVIPTEVPKEEPKEEPNGEEPKRKPGSQRERERRMRLEVENQYLREQLAEKAPEPKPVEGEPTPDKFERHEDYIKAQVAYGVKQALEAEHQRQSQAQVKTTWEQKLDGAKKAHPDLPELLEENDPPISRAVAESLMDSEIGGEVFYHLAKNPEECQRISGLSPVAAARAIGAIEAKIQAQTIKPPERKTSQAPPPVVPVASSGVIPAKTLHARYEDF